MLKLEKEFVSSQADKSSASFQNGSTLEIRIPVEHVTATNRQVIFLYFNEHQTITKHVAKTKNSEEAYNSFLSFGSFMIGSVSEVLTIFLLLQVKDNKLRGLTYIQMILVSLLVCCVINKSGLCGCIWEYIIMAYKCCFCILSPYAHRLLSHNDFSSPICYARVTSCDSSLTSTKLYVYEQ